MSILKPEHEELKRITREFTNKEVVPIADALDREEAEIPAPLLQKMAEMGFFGLLVPKDYGGLGLDALSLCVVTEEPPAGAPSAASSRARAVQPHLYKAGTERRSGARRAWPTGRSRARAGTEARRARRANIKTAARRKTATTC
jgi:alkylation response protein AidB-like acyl-CoA dehydrogenase